MENNSKAITFSNTTGKVYLFIFSVFCISMFFELYLRHKVLLIFLVPISLIFLFSFIKKSFSPPFLILKEDFVEYCPTTENYKEAILFKDIKFIIFKYKYLILMREYNQKMCIYLNNGGYTEVSINGLLYFEKRKLINFLKRFVPVKQNFTFSSFGEEFRLLLWTLALICIIYTQIKYHLNVIP